MKTIPLTKQTVVDCRTWARGIPSQSSLLRPDDMENPSFQCCLGFACEQSGIEREALTGIYYPQGLANRDIAVVRELVDSKSGYFSDNAWTEEAMRINDNRGVSDTTRVRKLRDHWKTLGPEFSIKFTNIPKKEKT